MSKAPGILLRLTLVSILGLVLAGCNTDPGIREVSAPVSGVGERQGIEITRSQAAILDDGVVTAGEYEKAVFDAAECLRAKGLIVHEPRWENVDEMKVYEIQGSPIPIDASAEEIEAQDRFVTGAIRECWIEHEAFVAEAWQNQEIPSEAERSQLVDGLVACLRRAGVKDLPASPSYEYVLGLLADESLDVDTSGDEVASENFNTVLRQATACIELHSRLFIIPARDL